MALELQNFDMAVSSLERACAYSRRVLGDGDVREDEAEILRAAVVQNFEFTYEMCWKYIKRWLDSNYSSSLTMGISRKQLFRLALENGLIDDFEAWVRYHELRNLTVHTYDRAVATRLADESDAFSVHARRLYWEIEARND